jgi:type IV pilus assembly protein PilB
MADQQAQAAATPTAPVPPAAGKADEAAQKTFYQLLKQDVSWQSIRDVLTYEIPLPVGSSSDDDLADILLKQGWIAKEQLEELRRNKDVVGESLGHVLVERGLITADQLKVAQEQKKATGQPLYRTLLQLKMALPQDIREVLSSPLQLPFGNRAADGFSDWLVAQQVLTVEALDAAWKEAQGAKEEFRHYLVSSGKISEAQFAQAVAAEAGLPYDSLEQVVAIPARITRMLPAFILRRHHALPYKLDKDQLHVAFAEAHHVREFEKMGLLLEVGVQSVIAPRQRVEALLQECIPVDDSELAVGEGEDAEQLEETSRAMPAVELLTVIVRGVIKSQGTDIHIEPQKDATRVRYRVDGVLHDVLTLDSNTSRRIITRIKSLAQMDVASRHLPQDGHLVMTVGEKTRNFRISSIPTVYGEKLAMRLVQSDMACSSFEQLGMNLAQRKLLHEILRQPNGLVLTTGPVGSGKTTTLYACLNSLDCFTHNIISIEDPVEYDIAGVNQVQVNTRRDLTFGVGLRSILRQDPDVIMIGEIRDEETAEIAVRAAMTGTLVLSTIHANAAATCISSFIQLGVRPYMVSHAISAILFQRLVRRICPQCKEEYDATPADLRELRLPADRSLRLWRGKGCAACLHTGYHGRTGVFELLKLNQEFRQAIVENPSVANLEAAAKSAEMVSLHAHASELVLAGVTTVEELARIL